MWATPWKGSRWCSQVEYIGMSRTAASARARSTGPRVVASSTPSGSGLDTSTVRHLDDLRRGVVPRSRVGAGPGGRVDLGLGARVTRGHRGADGGDEAVAVAVHRGLLLGRGEHRRAVG